MTSDASLPGCSVLVYPPHRFNPDQVDFVDAWWCDALQDWMLPGLDAVADNVPHDRFEAHAERLFNAYYAHLQADRELLDRHWLHHLHRLQDDFQAAFRAELPLRAALHTFEDALAHVKQHKLYI